MPMTVWAQARRRGDWWDVPARRRFAAYELTLPPGADAPVIGSGTYPSDPDLPYLMVVDLAHEVAPGSWIIRLVAHDVEPPPTFYMHLDQGDTSCSWASQPRTSTPTPQS